MLSGHEGYSVILFGPRIGKAANEGDLFNKFFNIYNNLKKEEGINVGWELINNNFSDDFVLKINSTNPENFYRLRFLGNLKESSVKKQIVPETIEVIDIFDKSQCLNNP
jgi:hypothetical protein